MWHAGIGLHVDVHQSGQPRCAITVVCGSISLDFEDWVGWIRKERDLYYSLDAHTRLRVGL